MLRLNLPTPSTPASVEAYPNRYDYELTPTSSEDSDSSHDGYEYHADEETGAATGALLSGLKGAGGSLGKLTRRAKVAPIGGGKAGKNASNGEARAAQREAKRQAKQAVRDSKQAAKDAKKSAYEPQPLQRQSKEEELIEDANQFREQLLQEKEDRREKMQQRIDAGIDRADQATSQGGNGGAACLRHCGTSCGSVVFQSFCSCVAIAGAFWGGFVALSWFEIIGISSLPPGIAYGHKVGDIYRS
jgi:hypothetical protein